MQLRIGECVGRAAVVEGKLEGGTFIGDRILVKHDAEYKAENPDRVPGTAPWALFQW